jgi:8-oxo-dGTP pyrophosphatase MutT (NUDIX family)
MNLQPFRLEESPGWERVEEHRIFDHPYIGLEQVTYRTPYRPEPVTWVVARRKPGVIVAPQLRDGRFLLIRQVRYPIQRVLWEFPAGQIDDSRFREMPEVISQAARREMEEETAYRVGVDGDLRFLGHFFSSQGFTDEHSYLFLATKVEPTGGSLQLDPDEGILECRPFAFAEIRRSIATGQIVDANTLVMFAKLCACGLVE